VDKYPRCRGQGAQRDVLALMAEGQANAGIAARLVITERAVGKHINNIFAKLGLPADTDGHRRVLAVLEYLQNT
jgi:DNA-binding NarL/FixJ family response regulator